MSDEKDLDEAVLLAALPGTYIVVFGVFFLND